MATITKDMGIMDVVQKWPQAAAVFMDHGMGCIGCAAAHFENIEQGASAHGIDVDSLIDALNKMAEA
jgi:hybrid cluster-associated redox disulfide protein